MKELVQILKNTRQHLMTGVSHMIPFVVAGGILLAVSVMLYGKGAVPDVATDPNLKKLFDIGVAGLTLMAFGDAYLRDSYRRHLYYRRHHDVGAG